ncbi:MAG: serine O-acetyltransferase [Ruminococcaceae bacterium]|nr:serine O-acetyltransferase [Oscillospiraceae bacterium]
MTDPKKIKKSLDLPKSIESLNSIKSIIGNHPKAKNPQVRKSNQKMANAVADVIASISDDVKATRERDPAARSNLEVLLLYPGIHALAAHRLAHKLYKKGKYFPARAISQVARFITGIEIHPGATIGKGLMIDHGMGVVIGETAEIGDNCTIYQGVTLGGTGKDVGKRHPTLGNNVMVGAGAKVLGPMKVGDNTKIAANAVVLAEIPENCTAVGIPAKVVKREGVRVDDLDQIHIPDPVAQEIRRLESRLAELEAELKTIKSEKTEKSTKEKKKNAAL